MRNLYFTLFALFFSFLSPKASGQIVGAIQGNPVVCAGLTTYLSDTTAGGTWVSSMSVVATVGTDGSVTGATAGTTTISYTAGGITVTQVVTVNPDPGPIEGAVAVCVGSTAIITDAVTGGTWSNSCAPVVTIGITTGIAMGEAAGTCVMTYTLATGCIATTIITVNATPSPITGPTFVCDAGTTTLNASPAGGAWSTSATGIATIGGTSGVLVGIATGTTAITYTTVASCISTIVVTVGATPPTILGTDAVCGTNTTALDDIAAGGTWTSSNTAVGTVVPTTGLVGGVSAGTTQISYILATGCATYVVVTVNPIPIASAGASTVCVGGTVSLTGAGGGIWSSADIAVVTVTGGGLEGVSVGTAYISYVLSTGCFTDFIETVNSTVSPILGVNIICPDIPDTLTDGVTGGVWTSSSSTIAAIGSATGIVVGLAGGTSVVTYTIATGCIASMLITINPSPPNILGTDMVCAANTIALSDPAPGGTWASSNTAIETVVPTSGIVTGVIAGTAIISYTLATGCITDVVVTVDPIPTITAGATGNCGGTYSLNGSGAGTGGYVWTPSTGLSCTTCAAPVATIDSTITYTVTGTDANGCINTDTVTANGNRISGYITMTVTPTDTLKVWLIQFDPVDSTLTGEDSTLSCMDGSTPYYEFDNEAPGSYMVKAKLLSSVAGTSGYVPTYGLSSTLWSAATTLTHAGLTDTQHINMIYGTVPAGPGFIGGLISSGAGRGTSGVVPAVGMLVYLKDASNNILTYTYTDATGAYSFSGLANGSYNIYPVDYHYNTTAWLGAAINSSAETFNSGDFYQHTTLGTITPYNTLCCGPMPTTAALNLYPNPAGDELNINWENEKTGNADIIITDVAGNEVYKSVLNINAASANAQLDIHSLNDGIYIITIRSSNISYTNKLLIQR